MKRVEKRKTVSIFSFVFFPLTIVVIPIIIYFVYDFMRGEDSSSPGSSVASSAATSLSTSKTEVDKHKKIAECAINLAREILTTLEDTIKKKKEGEEEIIKSIEKLKIL